MARTTTREIIKVCADIAKLDRRGKEEVYAYLKDELKIIHVEYGPPTAATAIKPSTDPEGGEQ